MPTDPGLRRTQRREMERVGALLRAIREEAGLRQGEVAARIGRPQQYVSVFEAGGHRLDLWELAAICDALGVRLMDVVAQFEKGLRMGKRSPDEAREI